MGSGHWRNKDHDKSANANKKFSSGFKNGEHKPWEDRNRDYITSTAAAKETCLRKYGVDNPSKVLEVRKKISDIQIRNGATPRDLRPLRQLYDQAVAYYTRRSITEKFGTLKSDRISSECETIDHIFSRHLGFKNNIPPYIIGHWTNLRVLTRSENSKKGPRCDKSMDSLFEDYFSNS